MRINKIITKRKIFDLLSNSLNQFFKEMYGDQLENLYVDIGVYWANSKSSNITKHFQQVFQ